MAIYLGGQTAKRAGKRSRVKGRTYEEGEETKKGRWE